MLLSRSCCSGMGKKFSQHFLLIQEKSFLFVFFVLYFLAHRLSLACSCGSGADEKSLSPPDFSLVWLEKLFPLALTLGGGRNSTLYAKAKDTVYQLVLGLGCLTTIWVCLRHIKRQFRGISASSVAPFSLVRATCMRERLGFGIKTDNKNRD
jgi:hypothetical protein